MRNLTAPQIALLETGIVRRRMLFRLYNDSGIIAFWDDAYPVTVGGITYAPVGRIPKIGALQQVSDLSVPGLTVTVPALPSTRDGFWNSIFGNSADWSQRRTEIDMALYDPTTNLIVGPPLPWFRGYFDDVDVLEREPGGEADLVTTFESTARELTRSNPAVRSDADQRLRDSDDEGMQYTSQAGDVELMWGDFKREKKRRRGGGGGGGIRGGRGGGGGGNGNGGGRGNGGRRRRRRRRDRD